jgi:BCD family chlorophyll transporter-like MFS transporter
MANAISRLVGSVLCGAVRDALTQVLTKPVYAYVVVFGLMALLLFVSLLMLRRINVSAFQQDAQGTSLVEHAALASEAS